MLGLISHLFDCVIAILCWILFITTLSWPDPTESNHRRDSLCCTDNDYNVTKLIFEVSVIFHKMLLLMTLSHLWCLLYENVILVEPVVFIGHVLGNFGYLLWIRFYFTGALCLLLRWSEQRSRMLVWARPLSWAFTIAVAQYNLYWAAWHKKSAALALTSSVRSYKQRRQLLFSCISKLGRFVYLVKHLSNYVTLLLSYIM